MHDPAADPFSPSALCGFARGLKVVARLILRRSVGIIIVVIDAISDEAAASLEAGLVAPVPISQLTTENQFQFVLQQQNTITALLINGVFPLAGVLLGRDWRAGAHTRIPTRLRVVQWCWYSYALNRWKAWDVWVIRCVVLCLISPK